MPQKSGKELGQQAQFVAVEPFSTPAVIVVIFESLPEESLIAVNNNMRIVVSSCEAQTSPVLPIDPFSKPHRHRCVDLGVGHSSLKIIARTPELTWSGSTDLFIRSQRFVLIESPEDGFM